MSRTTIELNLKTIFGSAFLVIGLIILGYVSLMAFQLATGVVEPLEIEVSQVEPETPFTLGILLQIGMFAILVVIAYILIKFGLKIILFRETE